MSSWWQELARLGGDQYASEPRAERIRHLSQMLREELVDLLTVRLSRQSRAVVQTALGPAMLSMDVS
jgi:hypothetical protein